MLTANILVVEDFERFRQFVVSTLRQGAKFEVAEASSGLEALQRIEEREPDLVLLDIGLPGLNGLEVARRLRKLAIPLKIVFISQESSPEIVREALNLGALGYVHKLRASAWVIGTNPKPPPKRSWITGYTRVTWRELMTKDSSKSSIARKT